MKGATTEKARLPRFNLVLGIESCCEVDDLSCLGMLEKRRLARRRLMYCKSAICKSGQFEFDSVLLEASVAV